uniref:GPI inositol-deacylase n=1 Tax=Phytophthora ramorum TaxID=164328 RepID=H3GKL4_PHYRM
MKAARALATVAAALVGFDAVAATSSLPSIKLGFSIQRSTMEVYGSVPYHQVINSTADSTTCLPTELFPSVPDIVEAIASATAVSTVSTDQDISCNNGTWLSATFAGESYVLCTGADADNGNFTVYGEDLSITFEYLSEDVTITKPTNAPSDCTALSEDSVALSSVGQLYGISASSSRRALKEEARAVHLASSSCTCQGTPRPCLFFHGMDVEADGGIVDSYSFFGDVKEHAPCCSSFSFAILNTVDYEWYNDTLQDKACNAAMNVSTGTTDSGSTEINDLIIVAHSMGNNMLAGALATGKCSIGSNVDWVDLSGPMKGSMGSDFLHEICDGGNVLQNILSELGGLIGQCPGTTTRKSLVYDGGDYCDDECSARYSAARAIHEKYVTASMCGTTYSGLLSSEYLGLLAGGLLIPHHSFKNDGIVEFQSCIGNLDSASFETTYSTTWYAAALNHADTTFHNGEGLFSSAKKPLKWFECLL